MSDIKDYPEDNPKDNGMSDIKNYPEGSPEDNRMDSSEIDRLPVADLPDRYNLARSAVYTRLDALGIKREKIGNRAYVNAEELKLLDALHEFINRGGNTAEFLESRGLPKPDQKPSEQSSELSTGQPELLNFMAALVSRLQPTVDRDPLAYFEQLEKAAQNGWHLKTSEVAELLDLSPSEIQQYGDRFFEAGFVFSKVGYRAGGEVAWKVSKPLK
jgi:hypothetical protein